MIQTKKTLLASTIVLALTGVTACGGGSSSTPASPTPTPTPTPTNSAPTDLALSSVSVDENVAGAVIGDITVTDADAGDTHTYTVNDARFEVANSQLKLKADQTLDFEAEPTVAVTITVTDSGDATYSEEFTLEVQDTVDVPNSYSYESNFSSDSSVSYTGQTARMVLIMELFNYIGSQLQADIDTGVLTSKAEVEAKLLSYYDIDQNLWDTVVADRPLTLSTTPSIKQTSLGQISSSRKDLLGKIAGQDEVGQHKDWSTEFEGWNAKGSTNPDALARYFITAIAENAQTYIDGALRTDPAGETITSIYISNNGHDLRQLLQKFLWGAVAFSQGVDDYLDDDTEGKGLLTDNTQPVGTKAYTNLEHQFDEGFGYFGATRDYNQYNDNEISGKVSSDADGRADWNGYHDSDADGAIDLTSEFIFGNAVNAGKRDRGATVAVDYSNGAFTAFLTGRAIINQAGGALSTEQMTALQAQRDAAVLNWEMAIAATVVHYINDTIADINKLGTADYSYSDSAKHWSEMKGFALGLQFNPRSPLTDEQYTQLQDLLGMQSALTADDVAAYEAKLIQARDIMQAAYQFDADNVANW